jgi:hypothetical protein
MVVYANGSQPKVHNMSNKQIIGTPVFEMISDSGTVIILFEGGFPIDLHEPEWVPKLNEPIKLDLEDTGKKNSYGRTNYKITSPKPGTAVSEQPEQAQPDPEHTS